MSSIRDDDFDRQPRANLRAEVEELRRQVADLRGRLRPVEKPRVPDEQEEPDEHREKTEAKPPLRQRTRRWARENPGKAGGILVLLLALLIGGAFLWHFLGSYESTDDAQVDGHLNAISSRVTGNVVSVYVENNDRVNTRQLLVQLDPSTYQIAADQARGKLGQAQAQIAAENPTVPITETSNQTSTVTSQTELATAIEALEVARRQYDAAVADLHQAQALSTQASTDEQRYRSLVVRDEVSRQQYDEKLAAARANQAAVEARRASVQAAQRGIAQAEHRVTSARSTLLETQSNNPRRLQSTRAAVQTRTAALETARAQLDEAVLNLSYCNVFAPVAGIIGNKTVEVGQHVEAGQPLFMLTQTDDIWVTANYKETELRDMRPGQPVTISVDTLGRSFKGYVESMPGATGSRFSLLPPENATGNFVKVVQRLPVRIRFNAGQSGLERLRPGMSVETNVRIR